MLFFKVFMYFEIQHKNANYGYYRCSTPLSLLNVTLSFILYRTSDGLVQINNPHFPYGSINFNQVSPILTSITSDERVTFWLKRVQSLPCVYVALFVHEFLVYHYAIVHTYNAANTHTSGSDRVC